MSKATRAVVALVLLQAGLMLAYWAVESRRQGAASFQVETLDEAAPSLVLAHAGRAVDVPAAPHLVHFWATWCGPCQEELPVLIAAAEAEGVPLLAVTDEPWPTVQAWFGGVVPATVVRDTSGRAAAQWRVSGLPDTFVVVGGRVVGRMGGPRDWSSPGGRDFLREVQR